MKKTKKPSLEEILTRGVTEILPRKETLIKLMKKKKIKLYLGIDPTGAFLTLGHSVLLRKLQQFADLGHEVILLVGNGTVKIGDPTGKDESRPMLTDKQIEENFKNWKKQASAILDFKKITIKHNGDWLDEMKMPEVIKLMAKTTIQQLIERDMFQERIKNEKPIHGHEIMYPMLQGYDSVAMNVDLEIGGNDQMFNMMMGRTLQKIYNNKEKWCLTTPILEGTDGRKMSKSYDNYIALTEKPNQMYGKLMSIADHLITQYFELLTDVPLDEIDAMRKAMELGDENPMTFKKQLALEITTMYHGEDKAQKAAKHFTKTIQQKTVSDDVPEIEIGDKKLSLIELLTTLAPKLSKSYLKRLVKQGGVELTLKTNEKIRPNDPFEEITTIRIKVVRIGKRRYYKIT